MQIILMIVCFLLIGIVLIQPSKADTNSALSGGNDNLFKNQGKDKKNAYKLKEISKKDFIKWLNKQ